MTISSRAIAAATITEALIRLRSSLTPTSRTPSAPCLGKRRLGFRGSHGPRNRNILTLLVIRQALLQLPDTGLARRVDAGVIRQDAPLVRPELLDHRARDLIPRHGLEQGVDLFGAGRFGK